MTTFLNGRLLFIVYIHIHDFYYDFGKTYSLVLGLVKCVAIMYIAMIFSSPVCFSLIFTFPLLCAVFDHEHLLSNSLKKI